MVRSKQCSILARDESELREVTVEASAAVEVASISVDREMRRSRAVSGSRHGSDCEGSSRMIGWCFGRLPVLRLGRSSSHVSVVDWLTEEPKSEAERDREDADSGAGVGSVVAGVERGLAAGEVMGRRSGW